LKQETHQEMRNPNATSLHLATALGFNAPPWDDLCKILHGGQWVVRYKMAKKYCQKFQPRVGCTNVTNDGQTTDRKFAIAMTWTQWSHIQVFVMSSTTLHLPTIGIGYLVWNMPVILTECSEIVLQ